MKLPRILALAAMLALSACGEEPTLEQQIIGVINEMETLAEAGERGAFMDRVDEAFAGQQGTLLREEFRRYLVLQWNQHQRLYAQLFPISVQAEGRNHARARFKALVTGGRGMLPDRGELYQIDTTWRKVDGDWLLLSADWVPVGAK
jgi:hypothetical protein